MPASRPAPTTTGAGSRGRLRPGLLVILAAAGAASLGAAALPASASATTLPVSASATTLTPAEQSFQASLTAYVQNLQTAVTTAANLPQTAAAVAPQLNDDLASLSAAASQIPNLTGQQIDAMAAILGSSNRSWQQQPAALNSELGSVGTKQVATPPPGYLSSCSPDPGDPRALFYSYWVAAQVASAANAVASGMPDGVDFAPATIIAGVIFGVANGIAIGLNSNLSLAVDCATAVQNQTIASSYPTDPSNVSTYVQYSSQISVNTLATVSSGIQQILDTIQTSINNTNTTLTSVINLVGVAQGTANQLVNVGTDLDNRTNALLNTVGTAGDSATDPCAPVATNPASTTLPTFNSSCGTPSGTTNGLANTIGARENAAQVATATFQNLTLRAEIEASLAAPSNGVLALFQLPSSQGGFLAGGTGLTVQSIVNQTIAAMTAAGQSVGSASSKVQAANTALVAGQYDVAWQDFQAAYILASS
jgi:hypothetical protein